jgi:hypothetical protein
VNRIGLNEERVQFGGGGVEQRNEILGSLIWGDSLKKIERLSIFQVRSCTLEFVRFRKVHTL